MKRDEHSRVDREWEAATWAGARREQMRRWAALPLEEIVAAQEEMAELAEMLANTPSKPRVEDSYPRPDRKPDHGAP